METEARTIEVLVHDIEVMLIGMEDKLFGVGLKKESVEVDPPNVIDRIRYSLERCEKIADHIGSQISRIVEIKK